MYGTWLQDENRHVCWLPVHMCPANNASHVTALSEVIVNQILVNRTQLSYNNKVLSANHSKTLLACIKFLAANLRQNRLADFRWMASVRYKENFAGFGFPDTHWLTLIKSNPSTLMFVVKYWCYTTQCGSLAGTGLHFTITFHYYRIK